MIGERCETTCADFAGSYYALYELEGSTNHSSVEYLLEFGVSRIIRDPSFQVVGDNGVSNGF